MVLVLINLIRQIREHIKKKKNILTCIFSLKIQAHISHSVWNVSFHTYIQQSSVDVEKDGDKFAETNQKQSNCVVSTEASSMTKLSKDVEYKA